MYIKVKLYGTLRRFSLNETPGVWQGEIPEGACVRDLIAILGSSEAEVAAAALNKEPCCLEDVIPDGAVVTLVTPVGGG
jgi:sulfur carrier protein ThiS